MKELIIKKCFKCGATIKVLEDCHCSDCGITCCGEPMKTLKANSTDASFEKHKPTYTVDSDKLHVTVNHVMDDDHYIEWLCLLTDNKEQFVYLKPDNEAKVTFNLVSTGKIYAYCNKHGLWETEIN